jgi:hypothetical protein
MEIDQRLECGASPSCLIRRWHTRSKVNNRPVGYRPPDLRIVADHVPVERKLKANLQSTAILDRIWRSALGRFKLTQKRLAAAAPALRTTAPSVSTDDVAYAWSFGVTSGHKSQRKRHVRFTPESGHDLLRRN